MTEAKTPREYAEQSEAHARKVVKAYRHALNTTRAIIAAQEIKLATDLEALNTAKQVMYEQGWGEES